MPERKKPKQRKKTAREMSNEELAKDVFPKAVRDEIKRQSQAENGKDSDNDDSSQ